MNYNIKINDNKIELPCAIGKPVYVIERCANQCGNFDDKYYPCIERLNNGRRKKAIAIGRNTDNKVPYGNITKAFANNCKIIYKRSFDIKHIPAIGKMVFFSFDDAINELEKTCTEYAIKKDFIITTEEDGE